MDQLYEKNVPCSSDSTGQNADIKMQTNNMESLVDNIEEIESKITTTLAAGDKTKENSPILAIGNSMDCSLEVSEKLALREEMYPSFDLVPSETMGQKRKTESEVDETPDVKKQLNSLSDEKKIINLRKNIRDVMDENQLDTNTIAAQREESERLARVAEQQKIIREHQRQAAVNRQFVRTQNRVLSLLQSGNTFAKVTEEDTSIEDNLTVCESADINTASGVLAASNEKSLSNDCEVKSEIYVKENSLSTENLDVTQTEHHITSDVVTIEDSSSEDDCILLSDDEEELEEEIEDDPTNSGLHVKDTYNVPDELGRVVVNIGHPDGEDDIFIAPQIAQIIKPHQIGGVRFLFDNIIESTNRFKSSSGFGCILSHSMGLGKTLQVVCFCDIFLRHTLSKTVLCVMPINTLQNWVSEFNMWIPKVSDDPEKVRPRKFDVYVLNDQQKTLSARAKVILKWAEEGGVLLIGYELFRLLALKLIQKRKRRSNKILRSDNSGSESNRRLMESINQALVKPGPDLVICDEGHRIKNAHAGISLALKQIRTRRRIVLTGYPLQNNLLEYWCMVDFVRPNYLGTRTEFCNMFERPIQNGQCIDSTPEDIKLMRYRAHVLHSLLVGFVQRRSHVVLQQTLPQKLEYVILARMTVFQRRLYDTFMNDIVRSKTVPNPLKAFAVCCKIWNHPDVLYNFLKKRETDLDLEIDDGEVMNEITSTETVNNTKNKIDEFSLGATDVSKPLTTSSDVNTLQPKTSEDDDIRQASMNSQNVMETSNSGAPGYSHLTSNYNNLYFSENYCQQNNQMGYSPNCGNNYWSESNVPYFGYQQPPSNMEYSSSKPNYVGMMVNEKYEQSTNQPHNLTSSSEIVDLDTKEIKTVETDINMSRNPVIKNDTEEEKPDSLEKTNSSLNETPIDTTTLSNNSQDINNVKQSSNIPAGGIEKEHLKNKSDDGILHEWAIEFMKKYQPGIISNSPKMEILFCILDESIKMGDRVLVFSQSLLTLNLIETFLQSNYIPGCETYWSRNVSYFRLDGSTTSQEREKLVNEFNSNTNVKLFLISTRAGSLGINLVGANRVIVFDASWNPCHDTQAVYRIYRYGQTKACFVYRIVMDKCLEKKIYDRQIKKQGMADRVVDECNPEAHLSIRDITNLCHDYDDDKRESDSSSFSKPLESYMDLIVQKLVECHKDCLSKEPFYHDSLLVDRKEKKLSQAEKRQAHRGYELEKKAAVKNTLTTTNKIQYRIVRNDGTVITRPVASIRPMQTTTKSQNFMKTGGLRTTRWIPAEVWQRQGMTAQEMTLPLDVVIPTHSNDKSNIILKSGQRVMVLKSAKGIYMQLESGKIIAIRTTTKGNETSKSDKDEVIDITSEPDTTFDAKNSTMKPVTHNHTTSNFAKEGQSDNNEGDNKDTTEYSTVKEKEYTDLSPKKLKDNSHDSNTTDVKRNSLSPLRNCSSMHSLGKSSVKNNVGPFVKKKPSSYVNSSYEPSKHILNHSSNNNNQSSLRHQPQFESALLKSNINNKQSLLQSHTKEVKKSFQDVSNKNSIRNQVTKINTPRGTYNSEINPIIPITMRQENPLPQSSTIHQMHNKGNSSLNIQTSNSYIGGNTSELSKNSPSHQRKGELNMPPESFQNTFSCKPNNDGKSPTGTRLSQAERLSTQCQSPQSNQAHLAEPVQYSQYPPLFSPHSQKQPQPKAHLYMPSYDIEHPQCNNSAPLAHMSTPQCVNPESNVANNLFVPNREIDNSLHHSESNSMLTSCEYPTQFVDYPNYNSYNHPHYFPHFHSNTYGNSPSPNISSNPYHMHWPPLVAPTPIHEQCNAMCAPTCTQNGTHSNQWHHKL